MVRSVHLLGGLLGDLSLQCSATRVWGYPWHNAVNSYSKSGNGHGGKEGCSAPLLLRVSLHRKRKHLCLCWADICGNGKRGDLCEKLGWHQRQGVLLSLYILDSMHRHMHRATCFEAACWLVGLQSPVLTHTDVTSCQQPPLIL